MMVRDLTKKTGTITPMRAQPNSPPSRIVSLDDTASDNRNDIDVFVLMKNGMPCIYTHQSVTLESGTPTRLEICNFRYPSQVMKVGIGLLDTMHPGVDCETGSLLIRALCGPM